MKMNQLLKIEHISKYYGEASNVTKALDDVSFTVEAGEFVGIMGGKRFRKDDTSSVHLDIG